MHFIGRAIVNVTYRLRLFVLFTAIVQYIIINVFRSVQYNVSLTRCVSIWKRDDGDFSGLQCFLGTLLFKPIFGKIHRHRLCAIYYYNPLNRIIIRIICIHIVSNIVVTYSHTYISYVYHSVGWSGVVKIIINRRKSVLVSAYLLMGGGRDVSTYCRYPCCTAVLGK